MRILHITGYTVERGGTAKIVYENAKYQISKGHEVSILSVNFKNEEPYPVPEGAKLLLMKDHWFGKYISNFSAETNLFFNANKNSFDLIHIHGIWFWGAVAPFFFNTTAKKVITIHGMLSKWTLSQGTLKKKLFGAVFQNKGLHNAAAIFVNTETEKHELLDYIKINPAKIFIVPNAVEPSQPVEDKQKAKFILDFGLKSDSKKILFLSRIHKKKGLDLLVRAFAKLDKLENAELLIAGPDEGFKTTIEGIIEELGIGSRVTFLGSLSGKAKATAFSMADVFALTSHSEGFPMAVLEAIEAKVPVVVSDQTRIDAHILQYNAGEVVTLDVNNISESISRVLIDDNLRNKYIENGSEMLQKEFLPEIIYPKMLEVYEQSLLNK